MIKQDKYLFLSETSTELNRQHHDGAATKLNRCNLCYQIKYEFVADLFHPEQFSGILRVTSLFQSQFCNKVKDSEVQVIQQNKKKIVIIYASTQGFRGPIQFRIILYNSNIKICKLLDLLNVSLVSKSRPYTSPITDPILIFQY